MLFDQTPNVFSGDDRHGRREGPPGDHHPSPEPAADGHSSAVAQGQFALHLAEGRAYDRSLLLVSSVAFLIVSPMTQIHHKNSFRLNAKRLTMQLQLIVLINL